MSLLEPPRTRPRLSALSLGVVAILLYWNPLSLALLTAQAWPRLARYGLPAWGLLGLRMAVVGLGIVAARSLLDREPRGRSLAAITFAASAALALAGALTPYFPSNAVPSAKWTWLGATVALNLVLCAAMARAAPPRT